MLLSQIEKVTFPLQKFSVKQMKVHITVVLKKIDLSKYVNVPPFVPTQFEGSNASQMGVSKYVT